MANTYSQVHLHFIFAPKYRQALIGFRCDNIDKAMHCYYMPNGIGCSHFNPSLQKH
ncbi:hypothetical protein SAMN05216327_101683 [Dyadobacter sp. SG02]|nr:hypothetical protein SAMN05216327_101683 [Dyadobacter sp. SG02]